MLGQPNAGKSALFNVISDIKSASSNFAGTTVDITQSVLKLWGEEYLLIDLPGAYSLNPGDEAEKVTLDYLLNHQVDLIINVIDASLITRSLEFTLEACDLGLPMVVALNMIDEAERKGIIIDAKALSEKLGVPIAQTVALYGKGVKDLFEKCLDVLNGNYSTPKNLIYNDIIESKLEKFQTEYSRKFSEKFSRFKAIKALENPAALNDEERILAGEIFKSEYDSCQKCGREYCDSSIDSYRHSKTMELAESISKTIRHTKTPFREKFDKFLLHYISGYFFLVAFFAVYFGTIFLVGSFLNDILTDLLAPIPDLYANLKDYNLFLFAIVDGIWQGISGGLGIVLPYFLPLLLITSIFEDTGYLARIAFLMDELMHKIGLHGKSVASFILGFGCSIPALYSARILENKRDRFITAMLIPFIPCTARSSVIFALSAAFIGPLWAFGLYFIIMIVVGLSGKALSYFEKNPVNLIIEIPDLKIPSLKNSLKKTWFRIKEFFYGAIPYLILGSIAMNFIDVLNLNQYFDFTFKPIVNGILGLPEQLSTMLVFGFFKKELVAAMITHAFGVSEISQIPMTGAQIFVFLTFVSLYLPCFSTFVALIKEFGKKTAIFSAIFSILAALISAILMKSLFMIFPNII